MNNKEWLKKKYPDIFEEVLESLNEDELESFRLGGFLIGRLIKDIHNGHRAGSLVFFKRRFPIEGDNLIVFLYVKACLKDDNKSLYQYRGIGETDFLEILPTDTKEKTMRYFLFSYMAKNMNGTECGQEGVPCIMFPSFQEVKKNIKERIGLGRSTLITFNNIFEFKSEEDYNNAIRGIED